ncbi:hypothetical protein ES703_101090 [subsurface metagenome]
MHIYGIEPRLIILGQIINIRDGLLQIFNKIIIFLDCLIVVWESQIIQLFPLRLNII